MTNLVKDRVLETTTTQGTGTLNLAGASSGFRAFSDAFSTGAQVFYAITQDASYEVGIGTLTTGSPDTLSRDTVLASSNAGAAVNWGSGTKNVFNGIPALMMAALSDSLSKSVAGGSNVTLTTAESYTFRQKFTGTLTANIQVIEKAEMKRPIVVDNSTAGAFTVTVKTAAGSGVAVTQGKVALLYCDGTDIVDLSGSFGGFLADVADDTTPQLGGDLDVNGNSIVSAANGDIPIVPNGTGSVNLQDKPLKRPKIVDYGETVNAIGAIGGGTQDIDLELGNVVTGTVDTSTTTFTFSNPPASGTAGSFTLILTNGGSQTVNWPASVDWAGGTAPTLTAAGVDILTFVTVAGGTTWYGFAAGLDMS